MAAVDTRAPLPWKLGRLCAVVGVLYAGYQITNHWHWREPSPLPLSWLDRSIPLLPWTIWPYLLLAGCMFLPVFLSDRRIFERCLASLVLGYSVNLLVFIIWPTMFPREGLPGGWHGEAFAWLYGLDSPANCFPSGHITAPFIAFHALVLERRSWRIPLWTLFALLSVTILTTKQHYVADLAGGLATGAWGVWLGGVWQRRRELLESASCSPIPVLRGGLANLFEFRRDPMGFLDRATLRCGPVVRCRLSLLTLHLVNDPEAARTLLRLPHRKANKDTRSAALISRLSGRSLLTANGDSWFRLRRLVQPAFHHGRISSFEREIRKLAGQLAEEWKAAPGQRLEVNSAMRRLTFRFICRVLLSADPSDETTALEASVNRLLGSVWQSLRSPVDWAWRLPTKTKREFRRDLAHVHGVMRACIRRRRHQPGPGHDLLDMLMAAKDTDTGEAMTDDEIVDECVTLIIAGYDTTANALVWAVALAARHPERLSHWPKRDGASTLPRAVFLETLRLYPPIWLIERNLTEPADAGRWHFPAGSQILISPWVLHRSPTHWKEPEKFDPQRFADPAVEHPAYLPFGDGPRSCIGRGLALMEGEAVLDLILKAGPLSLTGDFPSPDPGIALRPKGEVWITLGP